MDAHCTCLGVFQESLAKPWYFEILKKLQGKQPCFRVHLAILCPLSERATSPRRVAARESARPSKPTPCLRDAPRGGVPLYGVFRFPTSAKKMLEQNQGHQVKALETRIFKNGTKYSGKIEFLFLFTSKMTYFKSKRVNMNTNKIKN